MLDSQGKVVAESDDSGRNSRDLERIFTAPADGDFTLVVRDLNGRGGPRFAYLLTVMEPRPDFAISLASDRFDVTPGKTAKVKVTVDRKNMLKDPIEIDAVNLPPGVTARRMISKPDDGSAGTIVLELSADLCACPGPFQITGRTTGASPLSRTATAPMAGADTRTDRSWLTIHRP